MQKRHVIRFVGGAATVTTYVAVASVRPAAFARAVSVYCPGTTEVSVVTDRFTVAAAIGLADENAVVMPVGAPVTDMFTPPV